MASTMETEATLGITLEILNDPVIPVRMTVPPETPVEYLILHTDGEVLGTLWADHSGAASFSPSIISDPDLVDVAEQRWRRRIIDANYAAAEQDKEFNGKEFLQTWSDNISGGGNVSLEGPYAALYSQMRDRVQVS